MLYLYYYILLNDYEIIIEEPDLNIKDCMSSWNIIGLTGDKFVHLYCKIK